MQSVGWAPFENIVVNFAELPHIQDYKHLLVCMGTFSGPVEAFPTYTEKAHEVADFPWMQSFLGLEYKPPWIR